MGTHLAKMLSGNGHDITIIDQDPKLLAELGSFADVITIEGEATTFATLRKAAVRKCDLFIAVDSIENDNILSAMMAKQLGAKKSIARIDNNEYLEPNNKEMFINMGIDYLFYPEKVAADEENQETTIIDRDTFLTKEGITLNVGDKVEMIEDVTENSDSGSSSDNDSEKRDVYEVDISFAMVVEPDPESDNLIVRLIDANGNTVRKARLAGDSSNDDDSFSEVTKNGSTYTFEDLHLAEGTDFMFDLSLEGVQYLEQGVYIYKCTAGYDEKQTLVGVAEGEHNVDVSARFTVNFEVTESKSIVATRKWHKTTDPERNPRNDNRGCICAISRIYSVLTQSGECGKLAV